MALYRSLFGRKPNQTLFLECLLLVLITDSLNWLERWGKEWKGGGLDFCLKGNYECCLGDSGVDSFRGFQTRIEVFHSFLRELTFL